MKYIDADKLKVFLSDLKENHKYYNGDFHDGVVFAVDETEELIDSLQQEQDLIIINKKDWEAQEKFLKNKKFGVPLQQEQPSLPDNLDEAAKEYMKKARKHLFDDSPIGRADDAFKAGAEWQKEQDKDWLNEELIKAHLNGVMTGDRIAREHLPLPEDTVIFMKGVAEGRRLEREDRNDDKLYGD